MEVFNMMQLVTMIEDDSEVGYMVRTQGVDGFVSTRCATMQEVRFTKGMTFAIRRLLQKSKKVNGVKFESRILGDIHYREYRRGKDWYGEIKLDNDDFRHEEMRQILPVAFRKATGHNVTVAINFDNDIAEIRAAYGLRLSGLV